MRTQNRTRSPRWSRIVSGLLGLVLLGLVLGACTAEPEGGGPPLIDRAVEMLPEPLRSGAEKVVSGSQSGVEVELPASGVLQADTVSIASELGGRIAEMPVAEGDTVTQGQLLVQLDTTLLDARIEVAQATVALAQAGVAQARAGARPSQIAVAEAQLAQAQATVRVAQQAITDTERLIKTPQDLDLQIAVTSHQLEAANYDLARAVALKDAATSGKEQAEAVVAQWNGGGRQPVLVWHGSPGDVLDDKIPAEILDKIPEPKDGRYSIGKWELDIHNGTYELYKWVTIRIPTDVELAYIPWWQSWVGVNAAVAQKSGLEASLADLQTRRAAPQTLTAQLDQAQSTYAQAVAQTAAAQAQVDGLKAGATPEQIHALEARLAQAQAAVTALQTQRDLLTLRAPSDGTVISIIAHPGEVSAPGAELLTVANLANLTLQVYVPETWIGQVRIDQPVGIRVNSFPDHTFQGRVIRIGTSAQFTPRNVATVEGRMNLVFAVDISVVDPDGLLKPGMAADTTFSLGSGGTR